MVVESKQLELYETQAGKVPYLIWFTSIRDRKTRNKIEARIRRVRLGNLGERRSVGGGVTELVLNYGPGYRIYIGQLGARVVVLLCGGDKSTQDEDIEVSKEYWNDYKSRLKEEDEDATS